MRQRVLILIIGLLIVSVGSAIAVLAYMSRQATISSLSEQQDALTQFAVGTFLIFLPNWICLVLMKRQTRRGMSLRRTRSGGIWIGKTLSR